MTRRHDLDTDVILASAAPLQNTHNEFMFGPRYSTRLSSALLLILLTSAMLTVSEPASAWAARPSVTVKAEQILTGYTSALLAANHFLQAWQSGDAGTGVALLTSRAKKAATSDGIERFFSSPEPLAYEIGRGKLVHGRYEFPVVLVSVDAKNNQSRRRFSTIIVLHSGGNDWAVDKLP